MAADSDAPVPAGDIVVVAQQAGSFGTLVTALEAADLVETLQGSGPFTVFAPTDAAFAKIPAEQLSALLADKDQLRAVLTYHVVPGKVSAADVVKLDSVKTVQGSAVTIDASDGVRVDGARVTTADIPASNGVIHGIDTVILPKG
ncbi:MAG: fasciclin domain-containing protein [Myxococcota bacterium]|nr:fasciclin domain-containing protein [Myxococcota bacterium]